MESEVKFTTEDLMDELAGLYEYIAQERKPGGVTAEEMRIKWGCNKKIAAERLNKAVENGDLIRELTRLKPHSVGYVYYKNTVNNE